MTKYTERLMSRTSVAAMAAFAPKPEAAPTLPEFAERVEDAGAGDTGGRVPIDGLSAEEQAQVDAMASDGQTGGPSDIEAEGSDSDGDGDGADGEGEGGEPRAPGDAAPADAAPADGAARTPPRTISYGRHQKELAKAEQARADLQAQLDGSRAETTKEREERLRLDERTRMLLDAINTKQPPAAAAPPADTDPEPDVEADPIGHALWGNRKLQKRLDALESGQVRRQEETAAQTEEQQVYAALTNDINRVISGDPVRGIAADPTMADAFVHLRETRYTELGWIFANIDVNDPAQCATLSQDQQAQLNDRIQRTFHNEQMLVARQSIEARRSPADVIRNLARARGWAPKAAEPPAAAPPAARPANGAAPPAARASAPPSSVKDQLAAVRENLDASRSLSDAGGSPGGQMTPERLVAMSPAEFEDFYNRMPKENFDSLMGKPANM